MNQMTHLARKLVAREGCDTESISFVFFVQSFKLMVVRVSQTSEARHIYHNHHITPANMIKYK